MPSGGNLRFKFKKYFLALAFIFVVLVLSGFYFRKTENIKLISPELPMTVKEKAEKAGYGIYHQIDSEDTTGRTIFYQGRGEGTFERTGLRDVVLDGVNYRYIVGSFVRWEEIPDSEDKYMFINCPLRNEFFAPARIGFEESELFKEEASLTSLVVESLDWGELSQETDLTAELGKVKDWSWESLEKLIQPNDTVVVLLKKKDEKAVLRDENEGVVASQLFIRRFGGVEQLEKELGRKIGIAGR